MWKNWDERITATMSVSMSTDRHYASKIIRLLQNIRNAEDVNCEFDSLAVTKLTISKTVHAMNAAYVAAALRKMADLIEQAS